jgi:hypothetical protein
MWLEEAVKISSKSKIFLSGLRIKLSKKKLPLFQQKLVIFPTLQALILQ